MKTRHGRASATAALAAVALSCGCLQQYETVDQVVMPRFDHSFIDRIAVLDFVNRTANPAAGKIVADRIEELLVNKGPYKVVPRQFVAGYKARAGAHIDSEAAKAIGAASKVDALVMGTVEAYEYEEKKRRKKFGEWIRYGTSKHRVTRRATVLLYVKLVDAASGRVVWSKSANGNVKWSGLTDGSSKRPGDYIEEAIGEALTEVRSLFPHREKVQRRVN